MVDRNRGMNVPVSVVIPCYKCSNTIDHTVESVFKQTALPEELLLIDDASPDNGRTIAALHALRERFGSITKIKIIPLIANKGPGFARNIGWDAASQPFVAFLDADDVWHPQKLELIYSIIKENPSIDLIGHDFYIDARNGAMNLSLSGRERELNVVKKSYYSILLMSPFVTPSFFLKKCIPERFNIRMRYCEDYEFLLRIAHGYRVYYANLKLVQLGKKPFSGTGLTAEKTRMRLGEMAMHFEILKYRKGHVFILPMFILFSIIKHFVRLVLTRMRIKACLL